MNLRLRLGKPQSKGKLAPCLTAALTRVSLVAGSDFGDYELLQEIARGGMGIVFKARHKKLNRIVAIKMIIGGQYSTDDAIQRFQVEAEAAAKLDHPGIVPVYEIGSAQGQPFFAMKYIEGGSLSEQEQRFKKQPRAAARLVADVADAVYHAHQRRNSSP